MTLLLVNKYHFIKGGAERYYLDLGNRLSTRGDRVVYLSMNHPENVPAGPDDVFVAEVDYRAKMGFASRIRHAARSIYSGEDPQAHRRGIPLPSLRGHRGTRRH